jgi:superfamily II DNA or RNA helicase
VRGKRVLVLTKEVNHAEELARRIHGALQVDGRNSDQVRPALAELEAGRIRCVVGTSVIGEGVDVPAADVLVYAAGGRSKVKVVQDTYRVLTANVGKDQGIVIDVADNHHGTLTEAAAQRLALYRHHGFRPEVINAMGIPAWLDGVG